ncbi:glucose-6-phosphate isomerase [Simiduia agarivorans]|uniref:Glucose-6-phosphate isomerase n=1 Tax=Simiduia agarivorans (strain DSM 21679 / JCM 13881 / BCRC 17597 / SA1) TaxID=1117647 RepID=K4KMQ1_SIMAS|nr:glucose-6-phosphate isomerase [Simiduia agarivorans]AFV00455.1 glucose-6-phosphate isomerase [Simiduia agarivorans SA1 = DSM 21679]
MNTLTQSPVWQALTKQRQQLEHMSIAGLFEQDPQRAEKYTLSAAGITLDFSKHHINDPTVSLLTQLAQSRGVPAAINAMFSGEKLNNTENRQVLHVALRGDCKHLPEQRAVVRSALQKMADFVNQIHSGHWRGATGERITDVVNIGIGGSDLGPKMVCRALTPYQAPTLSTHFVSNVDGADLSETLKHLNPANTLFVVASKTFTTAETLTNARSAQAWLNGNLNDAGATAQHFVAVTSAIDTACEFGIRRDNIFPMWDWVGGRYSLWSAIGLPIALACGMMNFERLLAGAARMDQHFSDTAPERNLPVIMALLGVWYSNFWGAQSHAILPYDHYLGEFTKYIQQLDMESNGKRVNRRGDVVEHSTGPVIWGEVGTNGQHSFHQLLHQGSHRVPVDFIVSLASHHPLADHHSQLFANCLSQSRALMLGKSFEQAQAEFEQMGFNADVARTLAPHKMMPGNRPSSTLLFEKLSPDTLGALIALYEHKVFVQSVIWDINAFDQWGVELGKQLCNEIHPALTGASASPFDGSTNALVARYQAHHHTNK